VAGVFDRAIKDAAAGLLRGEGLKNDMKSKLLGLGMGLTLSALGVAAVPAAAAFADTAPSTCYTGCTTSITSPPTIPITTTVVTEPAPIAKTAAGASLPFTGADIEEMAAVGAGALMVGGLMVRRSRRVRRAAA
jgi:hypothetical protein